LEEIVMKRLMKKTGLVIGSALALAIAAGGSPVLAAAHSDFTKAYPLRSLKTFAFRPQQRISRDPLANNDIWANDVRDAIRGDMVSHGMTEAVDASPDFYVAFYVGLKDRYDVSSVGYGWPVIHHRGWYGWPAGYDAWAVPYTESTLIVDVIDARTNQLVWRGYDSDTLNVKDPDKTLGKAVDSVLARFYHDAKHEMTGDRRRLG
jgi:hypothetical protein